MSHTDSRRIIKMEYLDTAQIKKRIRTRIYLNKLAKLCFYFATLFGLIVLAVLLARVISEGMAWINVDFLTQKLSTQADRAGIMVAILGTFWLMVEVGPVSMILGLTIFVRALNFGNTVLAGGLTMSLLVLPIIVSVSQEAIRAVPHHLSEASYGLGATKWQTIRRIVLPSALPGILTGAILALSRAIGETAPLVVIGIPALLMPFPGGILDKFTVLPMQIYYWTLDSTLVAEYANLAAATIIVLLFVLFVLNATAIIVRNKFQKRY